MDVLRLPLVLSAVGVLVVAGCTPEMPAERQPPVDRVEAVFDADEGVLPMPNDAAKDADGTLPGIPGAESGTAEGELSAYMEQLTGWPRSMNPEIPFSGRLDADSIGPETVRYYRLEGGTAERLSVAEYIYEDGEGGTSIELIPAQPVEAGGDYAVVVTDGLLGENGESIGSPIPLYLAASPEPLADDDGNPTIGILEDEDPETVQTLERMRQLLAPVYDAVEEGVDDDVPLDRDNTVVAFRWTAMPESALAFDPAAADVPLPNTAALDPDGTFPDAGVCDVDEETAQRLLNDYLTGLSGWPAETPITVSLTSPVDAAALQDDDVQLWGSAGDDWERIEDITVEVRDTELDNCTGEEIDRDFIEVVPDEPMSTHRDYFAFVTRAGDDGEDAIVPELPMALAMQPHPLVDDDGSSLLGSLSDDEAAELEELRQLTRSAVEVIEDREEIGFQDLAGVWSWYTWNDTFAVFDPETGRIPFPNSLLMADDEETVEIPIADEADEQTQRLFETINRRAGFSNIARGWVPIDGELDETSLDFESFQMFNQGGFSFLEDDDIDLYYDEETSRIVFEPRDPLELEGEFVGGMTDDLLAADGSPVKPTPFFALLRSEYPVYEDGQSLVDILDDESAAELEEARSEFDTQLALLGQVFFDDWEDEDGTDRYDIISVWTFQTDNPVEMLREYRAMVREELEQRDEVRARRACEVEGGCTPPDDEDLIEPGDTWEHPDGSGVMVDTENISAFYRAGEFDSIDVDIEQGTVDDGTERIGLSVFLPEEQQTEGTCDAPFEVAISGHSLFADRWQTGLSVANDLAAYPGCMATVVVDFPGHGGRTPGIGEPHPESTPGESGAQFLTGDFVDIKQRFIQTFADLFALVRIIEGDGSESGLEELFDDLGPGPHLDPEGRSGYVGLSLFGAPFAAMEPRVDRLALAGSGGRFAWLLEGDEDGVSELGEDIFEMLEQEAGIVPGDEEFFELMVFIQWLADPIDPFLYGEIAAEGGEEVLEYNHVLEEFFPASGDECDDDDDCADGWECESVDGDDVCVEYTTPVAPLLQMIEGDRVVVNRCTEALAGQLGADVSDTTFEDVPHTFMATVDESADEFGAAKCARRQVATWLSERDLPAELTVDACVE